MRSKTIRLAIVAALIALAGAKVAARQPAASAPTATTTTAAKTSARTTQPAIVKTKASAAKTKATKTKATKSKATKKKTAGKAAKTTAAKAKATKKSAPVSRAAGAPAPTKPGPWKPNNPIAQELSSKPAEVARARRVLPAGTDLNAATAGFRNYSQFAAAMNATESKGLDYGKLKALMTGVTMDGTRTNQPTMSLSQATQALHGTATTPPGGAF